FYHSIFKVTLFKIETNGLEQIELATNNGRILSPINDLLEIIRLETQSLNFFLETALEHIGNDQIDTKTELVNEATIADCHTSPDEPQPKETSPNKTTKKKSKKQPPKQPENPTPAETNLSVIIHPLFITTMVFFFYMPLNMSAPLIVMALVCIAAAVIVVKKKCRNCGILRSCTTTVALFALTSITATTAIRIAQLLYEIHYYGNPLSPTTDNLSPLDYLATTPLPSTEILLPAMLVSVGIGSHLLAKHMPKQNPIDKGAKWRPYLYGLIIYLTWIAVCVIPFGMAPFFILLGIASAIGGLISLDLFSSIIDCCVGLIFGGFFIMCSMCLIEPKGPRLKRWSNCVLRAPWLILKELGAPVESPLTSETTPQGD
ncbi:MAG: hypothetical protein Q4F23_04860, partial [Coriobacteriia bacterium]|nr:hypothetical protein [Coriobacteriia bacterium]